MFILPAEARVIVVSEAEPSSMPVNWGLSDVAKPSNTPAGVNSGDANSTLVPSHITHAMLPPQSNHASPRRSILSKSWTVAAR